jgi:hypothetical protein
VGDIKQGLPSNRSFGVLFFVVFSGLAGYFWFTGKSTLSIFFSFISVTFLFLGLMQSKWLSPLNFLWMRFGALLGRVISPLVLGVIFFVLISPIALIIRLSGRDELHLTSIGKTSFWRPRRLRADGSVTSFHDQF